VPRWVKKFYFFLWKYFSVFLFIAQLQNPRFANDSAVPDFAVRRTEINCEINVAVSRSRTLISGTVSGAVQEKIGFGEKSEAAQLFEVKFKVKYICGTKCHQLIKFLFFTNVNFILDFLNLATESVALFS